jgi:hypothetical protein
MVTRQSHNLKIVGSIPISGNLNVLFIYYYFIYCKSINLLNLF